MGIIRNAAFVAAAVMFCAHVVAADAEKYSQRSQPIRIHPQNARLFEFRGKPLVLLTPTEHYGAVFNRPFDFRRYLADCEKKRITFTRLFILFRELQSSINPYSTCKPESTDYVAPYPRIDADNRAPDTLPRYDLDRWNPEFFSRLHEFVSLASRHGVIVEVVVLSNTYNETIWALNPVHHANNINNMPEVPWYAWMSSAHQALFEQQKRLVRKVVTELNAYDNIVFEVCNEPGGNAGPADAPTREQVDDWLRQLVQLIRSTEADLPKQHLVFGQQAFGYQMPGMERPVGARDVFQFADESFREFDYDAVNTHALSNMWYRGRYYNLGQFMMASMNLAAFRDYTRTICLEESRPLIHDEDNNASQYRNDFGWIIHRKRAWTALLCGAHYDYIDFSIIPGRETGFSHNRIREWFKHLSTYIHALDLANARPLSDLTGIVPEHCVESTFGVPDSDISVYIADAREQFDAGFSQAIRGGQLTVKLPDEKWIVSCFNPASGGYSPAVPVETGRPAVIDLPDFEHDIVIRLMRR